MPAYGLAQGGTTPVPQTTIVALSPSLGTSTGEIPAILDSGAAVSCLPEESIEDIVRGLEVDWREYRGPVGAPESRPVYVVHIRIGSCEFENMRVVAIDRPYALIGRDILNRYKVLLNGPARQWTHSP